MADINAIAQQFIDFYYQAFDSNRSGLSPLYVRRPIVSSPSRFFLGVSCVCGLSILIS